MPPFVTRRRVEFAHTDMAGMAHFTEYFKYMESAEHELFRSVGLSVETEVGGRRLSWPRISCSFDYEKPLRFEDEFEIHLFLERMGESSLRWTARLVRAGEVAATGHCTTVCCDVSAKPNLAGTSIPREIRAKLQTFLGEES